MKEFARRSIAKDSEAAKMLSSLEEAIRQVQAGKPVILLDADHQHDDRRCVARRVSAIQGFQPARDAPPGAGTDSAHAAAQRGKTKGTTMVLRRVSEPQVKAATLTLRTI